MLFDIGRGTWDAELAEVLGGVPLRALPEVRTSAGEVGRTRPDALHGHEVPVAGIAGDQQAALFGQAAVDPGLGKNTYGTGSFVLQNAGYSAPAPRDGLLSTVAWGIGGRLSYALESIAYQTVDAVRSMEKACGVELSELRADGGATVNAWLMQFQSDVLGVPVAVPEITETTALGAAYLAGVGTGLWTIDHVSRSWRERRRYEPQMSVDERATLLHGWARALDRARGWDEG
jgi:glycerol kinase